MPTDDAVHGKLGVVVWLVTAAIAIALFTLAIYNYKGLTSLQLTGIGIGTSVLFAGWFYEILKVRKK